LNLHSRNNALRAGDPETKTILLNTSANEQVMAYLRKYGNEEVLVILNFSSQKIRSLTIHEYNLEGKFKEIMTGEEREFSIVTAIDLEPWQYLVFER